MIEIKLNVEKGFMIERANIKHKFLMRVTTILSQLGYAVEREKFLIYLYVGGCTCTVPGQIQERYRGTLTEKKKSR